MLKKYKTIYLDYAATTPVDAQVLDVMGPYFNEEYANPSSLHSLGLRAKSALDDAREKVASVLNCQKDEIIFTSSGTEADNLALKGMAEVYDYKGHIIVSAIEHAAVLETARYLEKIGVDITYVDVDEYGSVNPKDVMSVVRDNTFLVSIMYANNEIGTIQPISEIGKHLQKKGILMHTDAVQAPGLLCLDVNKLHVDMMSLSAHKFYGPKGVGALYVRRGVEIVPQMHGGGQERKLRSATENVAGIVGFAEALCLSDAHRKSEAHRLSELRDYLIHEIRKAIPEAKLTGHPTNRLSNNASFCFKGVEGDSLVMRLSERGFCVSSGSACSSGDFGASHVLTACGLSKKVAQGSVRVSLGKYTNKKDLQSFVQALAQEVNKR